MQTFPKLIFQGPSPLPHIQPPIILSLDGGGLSGAALGTMPLPYYWYLYLNQAGHHAYL